MKLIDVVTDRLAHLIAEYDELCHQRDRAGAIDLGTARKMARLAADIDKEVARKRRKA